MIHLKYSDTPAGEKDTDERQGYSITGTVYTRFSFSYVLSIKSLRHAWSPGDIMSDAAGDTADFYTQI